MIYPKKQHRTTTTIDHDDWLYIKKQGLKIAHCVRSFVREHKSITSGEAKENLIAVERQRDVWKGNFQKLISTMKRNMSKEEFESFLEKL